MKYSIQEIIQYIKEEDVKFIRLAFCDVFGKQKNISIMPDELPRAFTFGIAIDASAIEGFGDETHSDLLLHPEADTLMPLPWRPEQGRVVRMFCTITYPDGQPFEYDCRSILKKLSRLPKPPDFLSFLEPNRSFICSALMNMEIQQKNHMIRLVTWTLLLKTVEKTSVVKFV